jgi:hypothetical protein
MKTLKEGDKYTGNEAPRSSHIVMSATLQPRLAESSFRCGKQRGIQI